MKGITVPELYVQQSSGEYFPNDADQSGLRDGQVTEFDISTSLSANIFPYKKYVASLTQTSTGAPVATVFENTLGATLTWIRSDTGIYVVTASSNVFTTNKTLIIDPKQVDGGNGLTGAVFSIASVSAIDVLTYTGSAADDVLAGNVFEVRVYP